MNTMLRRITVYVIVKSKLARLIVQIIEFGLVHGGSEMSAETCVMLALMILGLWPNVCIIKDERKKPVGKRNRKVEAISWVLLILILIAGLDYLKTHVAAKMI